MTQLCACILLYAVWMGGAGGLLMVAGLVSRVLGFVYAMMKGVK